MSSVYDKVKAIADERNLTISAIENGAQISNGSIMKWKKSVPRADYLYKVSKFLNVPIEYFLNDDYQFSCNREDSVLGELSDREIRIIELYRQLDEVERIKIEGMLEIKIYESHISKKGMSSTYRNGEEAATREKKHA